MSYFINPNDYNVDEEGIVIVYDRANKSVAHKLKISPTKSLEIKDKEIIRNIENHNFTFKIRTNKGKDSKDLTKYFYVIQKDILTQYWTDRIKLSNESSRNYVKYFSNSSKINELKNVFNAVVNNILINFNAEHNNLKKFLQNININESPGIFQNIYTYLKYLLELKDSFKKYRINHLHYDEYREQLITNKNLNNEIRHIIKSLEKLNLQFAFYLMGSLWSLLSERELAYNNFKKADEFDNNYGLLFGVGQGSKTYVHTVENKYYNLNVNYYNNIEVSKFEKVLISVDERFLRNYGTIILNNIITLRKYQFHIHVVGKTESIVKSIEELNDIYNRMVGFFNKETDICRPNFSYEIIDEKVKDINTYSACARFIHANEIIEKYDSDIYIIDADCLIVSDIEPYTKNFKNFDIGIALSRSLSPLMPWKRLLAGDSFFKNNLWSKRFLNLCSKYILYNLDKEKAWTLDQNAITYALEKIYEENNSFSVKNVYLLRRPFLHAPISSLIEKP